MATLWQMLTKKKVVVKERLEEEKIVNPLNLRVGNPVKIDTVDTEKLNFTVRGIREIDRPDVPGNSDAICDVDLIARPLEGDAVRKRLRLVPLGDRDGALTHSVILLNLVSEFGYDEKYHKGLAFENNKGVAEEVVVGPDGGVLTNQDGSEKVDTFWRVNDVKSEWTAKSVYLRDTDGNGKVDADEVQRGQITYWDFWRETDDEGGNKITEFYLVEMDQNGYFEIWRGSEIDANRVSV